MKIVEITALENGAHRNQDGNFSTVPSGWAVIPNGTETPNFPFGTFDVETVNGVPTMENWTAGTIPEPETETVRAAKLDGLSAAAQAAIISGCDVTLSDGTTGHISLTPEDQINLSTAQAAVQGGATGYPYHLDGQLCKVYSAADILIMGKAAVAHILYHTTYCNHLRAWVQRATDQDELTGITYGATLPDDLKANMEAIISAASV